MGHLVNNIDRERIGLFGRSIYPILKRYSASTATLLVSSACQFLWFVILARSLGVDRFGHLVIVLAVTTVGGAVSGVGGADAVIRRTVRNQNDYPLMLGHSLLLLFSVGSVVATVTTVLLSMIVYASPVPSLNVLIMLSFSIANVILFPLMTLVEKSYIGFVNLFWANLINMGFSISRLITVALACLVFRVDSIGEWAVWTLGGHLVANVVGVLLLFRLGWPIFRVDRSELRLGFYYSTPFAIEALGQNVDRFVLGLVAPAIVLGNYGVASRMAQVSQVVIAALNRILYPAFAQRKELGVAKIRGDATRYLTVIVILSIATATGVFAIAPLMPIILGPKYAGVVSDLRVLCWLIVPVAMQTVPYDILGAFDHHPRRASIFNSVTLAGAAGTAVAVYIFGVTGAFASVYIVQMVRSCSLLFAFYFWKDVSGEATK